MCLEIHLLLYVYNLDEISECIIEMMKNDFDLDLEKYDKTGKYIIGVEMISFKKTEALNGESATRKENSSKNCSNLSILDSKTDLIPKSDFFPAASARLLPL